MSVSELTPAAQDYVKLIWNASEWSDEAVTVTLLAERLGVSKATASDTIRRLAERGLVEHQRYGSVTLTPKGRTQAVAMVRRHRLLETFLVEHLGYSWDEVHAEAEVLEHAVSDTLIQRIDDRLGHPLRDPHGDPIPTAAGDLPALDAIPLCEAEANRSWLVARISDESPAVLRSLAERGVLIDARLHIDRVPANSPARTVRVGDDGGSPVELDAEATGAIWVRGAAI